MEAIDPQKLIKDNIINNLNDSKLTLLTFGKYKFCLIKFFDKPKYYLERLVLQFNEIECNSMLLNDFRIFIAIMKKLRQYDIVFSFIELVKPHSHTIKHALTNEFEHIIQSFYSSFRSDSSNWTSVYWSEAHSNDL